MSPAAINHRCVKARLGLFIACVLLLPSAFALDPRKGITQFIHRSWLSEHDISDVYSIAQTTDGYLWLATSNGTFRFDGVRFSHFETDPARPPGVEATPYRVLGSRDGSLWISRGENIVRVREGKQHVFSKDDGLPGGTVQSLQEGNDGSVWATAELGISKFSDERWQKIESKPLSYPRTTLTDRNQNVWTVAFDIAARQHVVARLRPGESAFKVVADGEFEIRKLAEAPDGTIWAAQWPRSKVRPIVAGPDGMYFGTPEINGSSYDILFDRDGSFWVATLGGGLRRARSTLSLDPADAGKFRDAVDIFTQKDGLSSDHVNCLFEGKEGEIWVGTAGGLDCFIENKFTSISTREGLPFEQGLSLQPAGREGIWAAAVPRGFVRIENSGRRIDDLGWLNLTEYTLPAVFLCLYADPAGGLLAGTSEGVMSFRNDGTGATVLPGTETRFAPDWDLTHVRALTREPSGTLWICDENTGVFRLQGGRLEEVQSLGLRKQFQVVSTCHADQSGRVWMGIVGDTSEECFLACYDGGEIRKYSKTEGLFPGKIQCILSDAKGQVWIAGQGGISRFSNGRFQTLTRRNGLPDDNILSVLQDDDGYFWLAGRLGFFRVSSGELENAFATDGGIVAGDFFNGDDGLRGFVHARIGLGNTVVFGGGVTAAKGTDGRLWFPTSAGVTMIDPLRIYRNPTPPQVHVQQVLAEGKSYPDPGTLALPVGTRDCQFDYIGICFTNPAKVRYKYRLEGYDEQWVEAGSRRQAFYSNLKPGSYKFRVQACNNDGVWNEAGDVVEFSIAPAFFERVWFPLVWLLPATLAFWGLHRLRLAQQASRMNRHLEAQAIERKRIARELHDTLLQGFIGVSLKLDAIATNLPESLAPVREQLRKILDQSDQYLNEARRSVMELRSASLEQSDGLFQALAKAGERLIEGTGIKLTYVAEGERHKLPSLVESHLLRIGEEAISNAVRHAHPTKVELTLTFGPKEVRLRIRDNGTGFEPQGPAAAKAGHFGLVGMQERVKAIGGLLSLNSQPGKGTEIIVSVATTQGTRPPLA